MAAATSVVVRQGRQQFQGIFSEMWVVKCTLDADSVNNNSTSRNTITVPGINLCDMVVAWSGSLDFQDMVVCVHVSAANTVDVHFHNATGGAVDLASMTFRVLIGRPIL